MTAKQQRDHVGLRQSQIFPKYLNPYLKSLIKEYQQMLSMLICKKRLIGCAKCPQLKCFGLTNNFVMLIANYLLAENGLLK